MIAQCPESLQSTTKSQGFFPLLVATFLLCGCSSTKFTEYHGSEVFQGAGGGSVSVVDGIDFWEDGDADRRYKILGSIQTSHKHTRLPGHVDRLFPSSGDHESAIAKAARKKVGDAFIIVSAGQNPSSEDEDGNRRHHRSRMYVVIKYTDAPATAHP